MNIVVYLHFHENCHWTLFRTHLLNSVLTLKNGKGVLWPSLKCTSLCNEYSDVLEIYTCESVFCQVTAASNLVITRRGFMFRIHY